MERGSLGLQGRHFTYLLQGLSTSLFETVSYSVPQAGLELTELRMPLPSQCWILQLFRLGNVNAKASQVLDCGGPLFT
ncbi:Uncharacterised protein [Chlamydia trachomatis]|nr:Uncharacterised protein [Chlamydia trachomatis]